MTTPIFPSVIGHNLLDGGTDAQDGNRYPGPLLQEYAAAVVGAAGRVDVLNGATAGQSSAWLRIGLFPERYAYQLDSGSTSTQYAIDISEDGATSLGQAFTGTWARSDLAYITGLISYSNPRAKYFRVTVISGGPLSFSRGF